MINKPKCDECGSGNIIFRTGGSYMCRRCGNDTRKPKDANTGRVDV